MVRYKIHKKLAVILIAILFATHFSACSKNAGFTIRKPEWIDISSYVFSLGEFDTRMMNFDMAIVDTEKVSKQEAGLLSDAGSYVFAYFSIGMERLHKNADFKSKSYHITDRNGEATMALSRGSYYYYCANPSDEDWRKAVLNKADEFVKLGYDGLLIDGLETAQMFPETEAAFISLIKALREKYPEIKLVMNGGYSLLKSVVSLLDGLLFEGFSTEYDRIKKTYVQLDGEKLLENSTIAFDVTNLVRARDDFLILALDYCDYSSDTEAEALLKRAGDFGFVAYCSKYELSSVHINYLGTKNARWRIPINISASSYFSGTFMQPSLVKGWSDERWGVELEVLKAAGIDTLILSPIVVREVQGTGSAAYPTRLKETEGFNKSTVLEDCLRNCKAAGVKVILDTYTDERWSDYGTGWDAEGQPSRESFAEYVSDSSDIANKVFSEIFELYGEEYGEIIEGWYISPDIWNVNISDDGYYLGLVAEMLNLRIDHIGMVSPGTPVMISPIFDTALRGTNENTLKQQWMFLFSKVRFRNGDIFCPRDSVGTEGMPISSGGRKLSKWMAAYAEALDSSGAELEFWCANEMFTETSEPCDIDRLTKQLEVTGEFVQRHIAVSYPHYFSPYSGEPFRHEQYTSYLRRLR